MNIDQVIKVLKVNAILLLVISIFMIFPAGIAFFSKEYDAFISFLIPLLIVFVFSFGILFFTKNIKVASLSSRGGFLLVTVSWLSASFVGALPFYISGAIPEYSDAFFETISGFTTTGASILTDIESLPSSMLFWRSLTHWLGGMGIVVFTVAILPLLGIGGLRLVKAEAPGPTVDKITPRITETAKILWYIYMGFTIAETILLMFGGMSFYDSLVHTFGTLATGGFSSKALSVGHYNSAYIDYVITFFMIMAGVNFVLHFKLLTGRFHDLKRDTELKVYLGIFFIATILISINLYGGKYAGVVFDSVAESFRYASFQVASILTTTGYASTDFEKWPFFSQTVLFTLMFIGGCSGSTGGGIKVIRVLTLFKKGVNEMRYLLHPRGIFTLKISDNPIKKDIVYAISGFFFLYVLMLLIVTFILSMSGTVSDFSTSFTTALATVGNIGPGFGKIGPADNYSFYPAYIKWVLSFAMLIGRLEVYTVLILFTPRFWQR